MKRSRRVKKKYSKQRAKIGSVDSVLKMNLKKILDSYMKVDMIIINIY
jgi:hypothetical protein